LEDTDAPVRAAAIESLANLRQTGFLEYLKRIVLPWPWSRESPEVKRAAKRAIKKLREVLEEEAAIAEEAKEEEPSTSKNEKSTS